MFTKVDIRGTTNRVENKIIPIKINRRSNISAQMFCKVPREEIFATSRRSKNYVATQHVFRRDAAKSYTCRKLKKVAKFATIDIYHQVPPLSSYPLNSGIKTNQKALSLFKGDERSEQGERSGGGNETIYNKNLSRNLKIPPLPPPFRYTNVPLHSSPLKRDSACGMF